MKKLLAVCTALAATTSIANAQVMADGEGSLTAYYDPYANFYVGGDLGYNKISFDKTEIENIAEDSLPVLNVYAGYNFTNNYAVEVGAFFTQEKDKTVAGVKSDTKESGMFVDVVGKYNVYNNLDLLGTAGIQYSKLKVSNPTSDFSENEFAPRLGLGAEYAFTDSMKMRGMFRYVFSDYDGAVSDTMQYTLGLKYEF